MNILITGITGLLGRSLLKTSPKGFKVYGTYYSNKRSGLKRMIFMDLRDRKSISQSFAISRPNVVIHTAGMNSVDIVEKERLLSYEINVKGCEYVIDECEKYNAKMIYISSNAVFDGEKPPYSEESEVNPIHYYGEQKVLCETMVKNMSNDYVIVRPILMYGWNDKFGRLNPVTWEIQKLTKGEKIYVVDDIWTQPLYSIACAQAIWRIIELNKNGIFHIAGADTITRYDFALKIAEVFNLDKYLISPVNSSFFKDIVKRPKNTSYSTLKMTKELGIKPMGVKEGLIAMKNNIF